MAVAPVIPVLLVAVIAKCKCEPTSGYNQNNGNGVSSFGELLKPPPPPPSISQIVPVPFHGGAGRAQQHNVDVGYHYQPPRPLPPPPIPPPPIPPTSDLKFPAPFYKQYNFNFVPPPQPFTTTPSPSLFQKFSGWLFPSQQTQYQSGSPVLSNNIGPLKKDCNPCNLVPWIPVIRYNLGAKNVHQNSIPTYGPPSPTAYADVQNTVQYRPQPFQFHIQEQKPPQISGIPHAIYGPPTQTHSGSIGIPSSTYGPPSPTYGPPSPTQVIPIPTPNPPTSTYLEASSSYAMQSSTNLGSSSIGISDTSFNSLSTSYNLPSSSYGVPSSTYKPPTTTYATSSFETNVPGTPNYETGLNRPPKSDVEILKDTQPLSDLQLPTVAHPIGFRNSYGEPIINTYALDIPYPVSATAAESIKIKTEVLPHENIKPSPPNISITLANPAPFTLNRGRNIHTLQPVALPNLSVSPLPPIFNARPFRPVMKFPTQFVQGVNYMQQTSNNVNIAPSIPVAEFTHSVDYPPSIIQSPIIDVEVPKNTNQTKAYRNILNGYVVDEIRDISSQASEDHVSATNQDSSFESTGAEVGDDIYNGMPTDLKHNSNFHLNQNSFADLRGVKDEDVDKYRTESNLQSIDSPLLYLKPSAPHKNHKNFVLALSTSINNEYEIYDDIPTTAEPQLSTIKDLWDSTRTDYNEYGGLSPPPIAEEDTNQPKIVQIIIPYTTGKHNIQNNKDFEPVPQDWAPTPVDDYQARKAPSNTEKYYNINTVTEDFTSISTSTEEPTLTITEHYDSEVLNTPVILNDLYDVKEPPFDIIKLQHNIDDWTEQEYSKRYKIPERVREKEKYAQAKQIPDEYFTTISPITSYVTTNTYNYELYDHEGSSSIQHAVTDEKKNSTLKKPRKEYNTIERTRNKYLTGKNDESEIQKLHIYTAASSFRGSTTTPAPWGQIQTSISPLTKEKVYVVTSKPWRGSPNVTNNWYEMESFESKKTNIDDSVSASDNLPFKSPRFSNRPPFGFTAGGKILSLKSDASYVFSKSWHQRINDLEPLALNDGSLLPEGSDEKITTNMDKDIMATVTADPLKDT